MPVSAQADFPVKAEHRIVFLGDSITDGATLPLLVGQALKDAGKPMPRIINAGIAGDTSAGMLARLKRDVLPQKPTHVCLSAGINDCIASVKPEQYRKNISGILDELQAEGVQVIVMTLTPLGPKLERKRELWRRYNEILKEEAAERKCRVAEVADRMHLPDDRLPELLSPDHIHISFKGYRRMADAVLDALGRPAVPVPEALEIQPLPGIIRRWKVRAVDQKKPLTEKEVAATGPDEDWHDYRLPEPEALDEWWPEQERRRGFALSLAKVAGKGKAYLAVAEVESKAARPVIFKVGARLDQLFLNGKKVYQSRGWRGWHPGREQVTAELKAGTNRVTVVSGGSFFLSMHDAATKRDEKY